MCEGDVKAETMSGFQEALWLVRQGQRAFASPMGAESTWA
jgi:hypothetical protein